MVFSFDDKLLCCFFLMRRRPPRSTQSRSSAASDVYKRQWSLTAAELRVAQYLPTNLSLSDIATRLYVSRNTVKSHAAAIYRKLGTSSRGEAVRLARSAGLIGDTPPSD